MQKWGGGNSIHVSRCAVVSASGQFKYFSLFGREGYQCSVNGLGRSLKVHVSGLFQDFGTYLHKTCLCFFQKALCVHLHGPASRSSFETDVHIGVFDICCLDTWQACNTINMYRHQLYQPCIDKRYRFLR